MGPSKEISCTLRLPAEWLEDVADLAERAETSFPLAGHAVTQDEILRAAVRRGLESMLSEAWPAVHKSLKPGEG